METAINIIGYIIGNLMIVIVGVVVIGAFLGAIDN